MNERSIFIAVLEMEDSNQRNAYLADACGVDQQLRERVEKLLVAHRAAGGVLDRPLIEDERTSPLRATAEAAGLLIAGRYKLLEEIGEGGMGTVWVAQQTEPIRRRVALKLIKPGMDSRQVLSRFEAERQALALMDQTHGRTEPCWGVQKRWIKSLRALRWGRKIGRSVRTSDPHDHCAGRGVADVAGIIK
jgi:hypothetical protein